MRVSKLPHQVMIAIVVLALLSAMMACATLRTSDEPAPTRRPTLQPVPSATLESTPAPFYFGG